MTQITSTTYAPTYAQPTPEDLVNQEIATSLHEEYLALHRKDYDEDIERGARAGLRAAARQQNLALPAAAVITETSRVPAWVDQFRGEWQSPDEEHPQTGELVSWSAEAVGTDTDADDPVVHALPTDTPGLLRATLPPETTEYGGSVRVQHDLMGEVTVLAYDERVQVPYTLASAVDEDQVSVELLPGAVYLTITRDADEDDDSAADAPV